MLARAPASPAHGLQHHGHRYFNFPFFSLAAGLEKLGLVHQNSLEGDFSAMSPRTLAVGRPNLLQSIKVALDMENRGSF